MKSRLICGDCIEELKKLPEQSVDLVFGSPPYEDARDIKKDSFPIYSGVDWVNWMVDVYAESLRVCRGLVAFVVQGRTRNYRWTATPALLMSELHRNGVVLRDPVIYHRVGIPGSGGPDWLRHDCEYIVCATNGGRLPWSDNTACGSPCKYPEGGMPSHRVKNGDRINVKHKGHTLTSSRTSGRLVAHRDNTGKYSPRIYQNPKKANPGNLVHCVCGGGHLGSKLAHENEAPFPEKLAEFFILSFCRPTGIVLDPFLGSGTTVAVAKRHKRRYIGIDVRESQIELTTRRLNELQTKE